MENVITKQIIVNKKKTYWKNVEQIDKKSALIKDIENKEFANQLPVDKILLDLPQRNTWKTNISSAPFKASVW